MPKTCVLYLSSARVWRKSLWSVWPTTRALTKFSSKLSCCPRWRGWPTTAHLWLDVFTYTTEPTNVACIRINNIIIFLSDINTHIFMLLPHHVKFLHTTYLLFIRYIWITIYYEIGTMTLILSMMTSGSESFELVWIQFSSNIRTGVLKSMEIFKY
jgi:hypothetical protein